MRLYNYVIACVLIFSSLSAAQQQYQVDNSKILIDLHEQFLKKEISKEQIELLFDDDFSLDSLYNAVGLWPILWAMENSDDELLERLLKHEKLLSKLRVNLNVIPVPNGGNNYDTILDWLADSGDGENLLYVMEDIGRSGSLSLLFLVLDSPRRVKRLGRQGMVNLLRYVLATDDEEMINYYLSDSMVKILLEQSDLETLKKHVTNDIAQKLIEKVFNEF